MYEKPEVELIEHDTITISIPSSSLKRLLSIIEEFSDEEGRPLYEITDDFGFMHDLINVLIRKDESRFNKIEYFLYESMVEAIEEGSLGVEKIEYSNWEN